MLTHYHTNRVGDFRLRVPQPVAPYTGTVNVTTIGNQCIQQAFSNITFPSDVPASVGQYLAAFVAPAPVPQSEDCMHFLFQLRLLADDRTGEQV